MPTPTLTTPEVIPPIGQAPSHLEGTRPPEVFGIDTIALQRLSEVAVDSTLFPKAEEKLRWVPLAVRMAPFIESALLARGAVPESATSKRTVSGFVADKLKMAAGKTATRRIERKLERGAQSSDVETAEKTQEMRDMLEKAIETIEAISDIHNPREQFVNEVSNLSREVSAAIITQRDRRVAGKAEPQPKQKGFMGFAVHVVRKVKGFFKRLFGRPEKPVEVTADDAGVGIEKTFRGLKSDPDAAAKQFPLLSKLVLDHLPVNKLVNREYFALVAPEILSFLFSAAKKDDIDENLFSSVERNSHPFRRFIKYKKNFGNYSVEAIQRASHTLMPALRDVLPTQGDTLSGLLHYLQSLAIDEEIASPEDATESPEVITKVKDSKFTTMKSLLKGLRARLRPE